MVNVLIKPLYEVSCWNKTTQFISHPFLMISRRIENNQINREYGFFEKVRYFIKNCLE